MLESCYFGFSKNPNFLELNAGSIMYSFLAAKGELITTTSTITEKSSDRGGTFF